MSEPHNDYRLSEEHIERFANDGYLSPIDVFDAAETQRMRAKLEQFEADMGKDAAGLRTDLHLLEDWAWQAVVDPRIVQPVCSLLGPDVLLWSINWFIKEAQDGKFVSMHQDANYWGLEPHDVVTAWVAISDAGEATGPMRFIPGSHRSGLHEHDNTFAPDNLLTRGQQVKTTINEDTSQLAPLQAGQMSLHHVRLIHGSGPNQTPDRRIGMVLRFCATHVRQTKGADTAVLVAGQDEYQHFELLPRPQTDRGEMEQARHRDAVGKLGRMLMADN